MGLTLMVKEYETYKNIYTQEQIDENYNKYVALCYQRDDVNFILEDLYYWMQNGYNLNKTLNKEQLDMGLSLTGDINKNSYIVTEYLVDALGEFVGDFDKMTKDKIMI